MQAGAAAALLAACFAATACAEDVSKDVREGLRSAKQVTVQFVRGVDRPARFATQRPCAVRVTLTQFEKRLDPRWTPVLIDGLGSIDATRCGEACCTPCRGDTSLRVSLALLFDGKKGPSVDLRLDSGIGFASNQDAQVVTACFRLGERSRTVLRVLREALGDSTFLADLSPCDSSAFDTASSQGRSASGGYVDALPAAITKVPPRYPDDAREAGVQGEVHIAALINAAGFVDRTIVVQSIPPLDAAAVLAVEQWRFRPARAGSKTIPVWVTVPVRFTLH